MADYDPHAYPPIAITADVVVFTIRDDQLNVLLVERGVEPDRGLYALPGGFVQPQESVEDAAERELREETNLCVDRVHLEELRVYSNPKRDPRMRVVTVAFLAFIPDLPVPQGSSDAASACWLPVRDALAAGQRLAFDHGVILRDALHAARGRLENTTLAIAFCPDTFTISEMRRVYEVVWDVPLDSRNFHRKVTSIPDFLVPTGERTSRDGGRPALLYSAGSAKVLSPPIYQPGAPDEHPQPKSTPHRSDNRRAARDELHQ